MKGFVGQKSRNYRRRHCSQLADNDDDDDEDGNDSNENSNAGGDGDQKPFCEIRTPNVIVVETRADVDGASGANSTSGLGEEQAGVDGVLPNPSVASSTKGGDGGQNGTRIASGIGFHMLRAMGWTENTGLGQSRKGMVDPILPTSKAGNLGIGFNATSVYDTQQEAIRRIQKAKRDERDRKLKLKVTKL